MSVRKDQSSAALSRDFKHRVLTCLHKLSDRDTHTAAAAELETIAKTLPAASISPFLSSISATDAADKSPVRKQCVRLISLLSESHGNVLSPHLSKLLGAVIRRLRDPDSAVRSACVAAMASISCHVTKPPFTAIVKPLFEALATEQDVNAQTGAALCLAAAIDGAPEKDVAYLRRLLPRIEKLVKCESFRAKAAVLAVVGSVIGAGAASREEIVSGLVKLLVEVLRSEDWATRKAAAEALEKLAVVEAGLLSEFKAECLKTFEAKRFDKVKGVREAMSRMIEAWKEIPDVPAEVSPPLPESQSSSKEVASDGRYPPDGSERRKTHISSNPAAPYGSSTSTVNRRNSLDNSSNRKIGPAVFRKLDRKKPGDWKIDVATPPPHVVTEDYISKNRWGSVVNSDESERITRRVLFDKNTPEKFHESRASNIGARVVHSHDELSESGAMASNISEEFHKGFKDCEDLSLIRKQLSQIESQQSNLFNLLQSFIGSSQTGMRSLESRVHGLELVLDEISFDLARSTGIMSNTDSTEAVCCKLPGADFLSSKLWRKTGGHSNSKFLASVQTPSLTASRHLSGHNVSNEANYPNNRRLQLQNRGSGLISNPLAKIHHESHGILEESSSGVSTLKTVHGAV